jgi:hypothetical protein
MRSIIVNNNFQWWCIRAVHQGGAFYSSRYHLAILDWTHPRCAACSDQSETGDSYSLMRCQFLFP